MLTSGITTHVGGRNFIRKLHHLFNCQLSRFDSKQIQVFDSNFFEKSSFCLKGLKVSLRKNGQGHSGASAKLSSLGHSGAV